MGGRQEIEKAIEPAPTANLKIQYSGMRRLIGVLAVLTTSNLGLGQSVLWDQVGDVPRDVQPAGYDYLGDIDGDGIGDFITASPMTASGIVRSGATNQVLHRDVRISAHGFGTGMGGVAAGVGDFDGDLVPDFAVTAYKYAVPGLGLGTGMVFVYSGQSHTVIARLPGLIPGEAQGFQLLDMGDVNSDGYSDIGVATLYGSKFRIYLGPNGSLFRNQTVGTATPEGKARFGDYDGDGCDDYLVGHELTSTSASNGGGVQLLSGLTGQVLLSMSGDRPDLLAGGAVCRGGDWNGDGVEDIVAGAPGTQFLQSSTHGTGVYVFSGADGSILHFFDGERYCLPNSAFGWSVGSGKDVNGDGVPDLIVGAPLQPYNNIPGVGVRGSAFVFSGATKELLWEYTGSTSGESAGTKVSLIDDHDGDGLADWMVMGPKHEATPLSSGVREGRITLFAGAVGDLHSHCSAGPNSMGSGAVLSGAGPISLRQNRFALALKGMPQSTLAMLFQSPTLSPPVPLGIGELCLGSPRSMLTVMTTTSDPNPNVPGEALFSVDLSIAPFSMMGQPLQPGNRRTFQVIYRDQSRRNTSNALEAVFPP